MFYVWKSSDDRSSNNNISKQLRICSFKYRWYQAEVRKAKVGRGMNVDIYKVKNKCISPKKTRKKPVVTEGEIH